jgi:hypothetical protein
MYKWRNGYFLISLNKTIIFIVNFLHVAIPFYWVHKHNACEYWNISSTRCHWSQKILGGIWLKWFGCKRFAYLASHVQGIIFPLLISTDSLSSKQEPILTSLPHTHLPTWIIYKLHLYSTHTAVTFLSFNSSSRSMTHLVVFKLFSM